MAMTSLLVACSSFALFAGVGAHSNDLDHPDWQAKNPIGTVGIEYEHQISEHFSLRGSIEHFSSMKTKDAKGFNLIGGQILYRFGH